jgi:hypothetical protein
MGDPLNENGQMVTLTERLMVSGGDARHGEQVRTMLQDARMENGDI